MPSSPAGLAAQDPPSQPAARPSLRLESRPDGPAAPARRGPGRAALATARPRQWVKNALVIAAAGAAGALGHDDVPLRVSLACLAFCMLSAGIYAINDVRDVDEDRRHPRKRFRPVAAGELSLRAATVLGGALMVAGLAVCAAVRPELSLVGAGYLAITLSYTMVWRHLLLLDIAAIAGGFVLRAVAGGVAAPVALSRWFLIVVTAAAVFIAAAKRSSEVRRAAGDTLGRRKVLVGYTPRRLRVLLDGSVAVAVAAYAVWAIELPQVNGVPWRPLTIVPFALALLRYRGLVRAGRAEAPEEVLISDRPLQAAALGWLVLFALGVHAAA